jgi:hypothetical protein
MNNPTIKSAFNSLVATITVVMIPVTGLLITTNPLNPAHAETGKGEDIFKVIMTIFEADKSKGDIVVIVTANNGEASRVKFLDTDILSASNLTGSTTATATSPRAGEGIIEYVATSPNVTVNTGAEYKACVITTMGLELTCTTGNNSPATRPEFVDISLNANGSPGESVTEEESETEED